MSGLLKMDASQAGVEVGEKETEKSTVQQYGICLAWTP